MPATIPFLAALTNNLQSSQPRHWSLRHSASISSLRSSFSSSKSSSSSSSFRSLGRSSTSGSRSSFALSLFDPTPAAPPPPPLQSYPPRPSYYNQSHNNHSSYFGHYPFHSYELEIQEERGDEAYAYELASMEFENFHAARVEQDEKTRPRASPSSLSPEKHLKLGRRSEERWEKAEREVRGREGERERRWTQDVEEEKCVWWIGR